MKLFLSAALLLCIAAPSEAGLFRRIRCQPIRTTVRVVTAPVVVPVRILDNCVNGTCRP